MTADIHALVGAYVLDALDDIERAAVDRHLRDCEACRTEADELRETTARLADGVWSVPRQRLRDNVMAEIATTRQLAPESRVRTGQARTRRFVRPLIAAASVVAIAAAGATTWTVQEQRVRQAQTAAEQARVSESRLRSILAAPDLVMTEERLTGGGRVTVASSRLHNAGVVTLAADGVPAAGHVYQLWTFRAETPTSAGALAVGQSAVVQIVEGLPGVSAVGVTVEPAPGSATPTTTPEAIVKII